MRRVLLVLALVAAAACARTSERHLASAFEDATLTLRRGELDEARALTERGLSLAQADSVLAWRFRLLRGEILLLQHQPSDVLPLVSAPVPPQPAFDPI